MYPQVQFMGEEKDNRDIDFSGAVWILDPVDGTTNLIHDFRCSALSLALCDRGQLELGIIYQPYRDELFLAQRGRGAFLNGSPIHVSSVSDLGQSLISIEPAPITMIWQTGILRISSVYSSNVLISGAPVPRQWIWPMLPAEGWMHISSVV